MAAHSSKKIKLDHPQTKEGQGSLLVASHLAASLKPHRSGSLEYTLRPSTTNHKSHPPQSFNAPEHISQSDGSSIFRLQLQELLAKVRPSHGSWMNKAEDALRKLKRVIELIPERAPTSISSAGESLEKLHKIVIPFPDPQPSVGVKYAVAYSKPENISIVGSYARKTAIRTHGNLVIDLAITMPSLLFQAKDYLNYRYFHKRAYYLAYIAAGIQGDQDLRYTISFDYQNGNQLQPIILLNPSLDGGEDGFSKSKWQIRIILAASEHIFPITKTLPRKDCIRNKATDGSSIGLCATAFYNATLRSECSSLPYLELFHRTSMNSDGFGDACSLGSIWLQQRGLGTNLADGGFGQFEWACIMAILFQGSGVSEKALLSKRYDSYQLFKATLQYLATTDFLTNPVVFSCDESVSSDQNHPMFFDGKRGLNVLFKMTKWSYHMLRHEANITLRNLNEPFGDKLSSSFITKVNEPFHRFDYIFSVLITPSWKPSESADSIDRCTQFCGKLYEALTTGLGDRVNAVYLQFTKDLAWPVADPKPSAKNQRRIVVGLLLHPEKSRRMVDHGPPAEDKPAATAFRTFWGEKAELRRFKDGSILESLIWSADGSGPGPGPGPDGILEQIVTYVLRRHMGTETAEKIRFHGGDAFNRLLAGSVDIANPLADFRLVDSSFENLEREIRNLEGLPLHIRQISAASPQLRFASPRAPGMGPLHASSIHPADVCLQFEGSTRWPDNLAAIQRTKVAFLLKIGELMEERTAGLVARVGLENKQRKLLNQAFLDVIYPTGASFRVRIHHERELNILERSLRDKSSDLGKRAEVAFAKATYKRDFIQSPLHTQAVRTLSTRFPLLSPSIRLMKKWRDYHMLSPHISDELIELLTVRTFVHPYPWQAPASVMTGFLRTVAFIARWEWQSEPLIVDFNHEMSVRDVEGINLRFEAWRKIDPGMNRVVMFVVSNLDPEGITWTEHSPSKVIAARLTNLARAARKIANEQALDIHPYTLFKTSTADYDFIIHLNPKVLHDRSNQVQKPSLFKNLQLHSDQNMDLVGFDPVKLYLDEIIDLYDSNIIFFHNALEGTYIAGVWKPHTDPREWKINLGYSTLPCLQPNEAAATAKVNKLATLHDIVRQGGDLVSRIEVKQECTRRGSASQS